MLDGGAQRDSGWRAADRSAAEDDSSGGSDSDSGYETIRDGETDAEYTQCVPRVRLPPVSAWGSCRSIFKVTAAAVAANPPSPAQSFAMKARDLCLNCRY